MQIRPRFKTFVALSLQEIRQRIQFQLDKSDAPCRGTVLKSFAVLRIPSEQQHYWSPELSIEAEEKENGTEIRGLFAPKPPVWTFFASLYFLIIFVGIAGGFYGLIQLNLGMAPNALWTVPFSLFSLGGAYALAYTGQKLSQSQMLTLRSFLMHAIAADPEATASSLNQPSLENTRL